MLLSFVCWALVGRQTQKYTDTDTEAQCLASLFAAPLVTISVETAKPPSLHFRSTPRRRRKDTRKKRMSGIRTKIRKETRKRRPKAAGL